jgi:hypothetical protein
MAVRTSVVVDAELIKGLVYKKDKGNDKNLWFCHIFFVSGLFTSRWPRI